MAIKSPGDRASIPARVAQPQAVDQIPGEDRRVELRPCKPDVPVGAQQIERNARDMAASKFASIHRIDGNLVHTQESVEFGGSTESGG